MSIHYSPDPAAREARPDVLAPLPVRPERRLVTRLLRSVGAAGAFLAVTFVLGVLFFLPVFALNVTRIEALEIAGEVVPISAFMEQLGALFLGTLILALAVTSFVANLLLHAADATAGPIHKTVNRKNAQNATRSYGLADMRGHHV